MEGANLTEGMNPMDAATQTEGILAPLVAEPQVAVSEQSETPTLRVRLKTGRFPYRRAGFVFPSSGAWHETSVEGTQKGAEALSAWIGDPAILVEAFTGEDWEAVNEIPEPLKEYLEKQAPDQEPKMSLDTKPPKATKSKKV